LCVTRIRVSDCLKDSRMPLGKSPHDPVKMRKAEEKFNCLPSSRFIVTGICTPGFTPSGGRGCRSLALCLVKSSAVSSGFCRWHESIATRYRMAGYASVMPVSLISEIWPCHSRIDDEIPISESSFSCKKISDRSRIRSFFLENESSSAFKLLEMQSPLPGILEFRYSVSQTRRQYQRTGE